MTEVKLLVCGAFNDEERARFDANYPNIYAETPDDIAAVAEDIRAGITAVVFKGHAPFGGAAMDPLGSLGLIANFGVGYDAIDVAAASARGVKVTNTPNVLNDDVADLAVGMMLAQTRNMVKGDALTRSGQWAAGTNLPLNRKMSGGTVGICGMGRIGREIADRLAAFKMDIHYHSRSEKETPGWTYHADPVSLAKAVDWFVVALVGGSETEGYVSAEVINALGEKGIICNISRGSTIDEGAMLDALEQGKIAGAALDVFLNEPKIDERFYALKNVVLQPHQGSGTHETRRDMAELQLSNVTAYFEGRDLVTPVN